MKISQGLGRAVAVLFALGLSVALVQAQPAAPRPQPSAPPRGLITQPAGQPRVDLNLVLAGDASGRVDDERFELQKQGYAKAFLNPRVLNAIRNGNEAAIAISMVQWTGPTLHVIMVPWMVVKDQ